MTHHRPWFALWRSGAPKTLEPYPEASAYSMLVGAATAYPDSVALAFLGKHISYRSMLREVERFSAGLAGLGCKIRPQRRPWLAKICSARLAAKSPMPTSHSGSKILTRSRKC